MLKPAAMKRMELLVLERDIRAVTEGLGRLGVVHLEEARAAEGGELVTASDLAQELAQVHRLRERVGALCDTLEITEGHAVDEVPFVGLSRLEGELEPIEKPLEGCLARRRKLDAEIETQYQVLRDLGSYRTVDVAPAALRGLDFLHFAVGTIPAGEVGAVQEEIGDRAVLLPFKSASGQQRLVALSSRTGRFALDSVLGEHAFEGETLPDLKEGAPAEVVEGAQERLLALAREQGEIRGQTRQVAEEFGGRLAAYRQRLRVDEQLLEAQAYFGRTSSTVLISGYVPSVRVDALREAVLGLTGGKAVVEVADPPEDDPNAPTLMDNPKLLKPFELLVSGYGQPGYREVEPTLFVALSFLLMFGVMFGDVGQGAVLVLVGLGLRRWVCGEKAQAFGALLAMAGAAAIVVGWVYGSVFGYEGALHPPLGGWFQPMEGGNISRLLVAAIVLGVVVISLGVVLNVVNRIRARDYFGMIVDRFGVVGFILYWGALGLGIRAAVSKGGGPSAFEVSLLIVLPLVVLFFREPLRYLVSRKDNAHKPRLLTAAIEGFVDVLETVSAYVANTVSFVRVGAFALAHAAICLAIFSTEEAVRSMPAGPLWSALVIVLGNAFVIGLEGLVVSIQAMRLEYYEFFGKFFKGEGKAYQPFKLS